MEPLEQELPDAGLLNGPGQRCIHFLPAVEPGQIEGGECVEQGRVVGRVGNGGHVRDDELPTTGGVSVGKVHDGLAAHAVAEEVGFPDAEVVEGIEQVDDHVGVPMARVVGTAAVVPLVDEDHGAVIRPPAAQGLPVVGGAEQAVQDDQGRWAFRRWLRAEDAVEQHHGQERGLRASLYWPTAFWSPRYRASEIRA